MSLRPRRHVPIPSRFSRIVSGTIGYTIAGFVLFHFLTHNQPYGTHDLILAAFGMVGLNLGIGQNVNDGINAVTRLALAIRSGRRRDTVTGQFKAVPK